MRREKFISGGLEGAGVEGKNKKKLSSEDRHEDEEKDLMDTGFGNTERPQVKKSSGSRIKSEDPFYTGFGETRQEKRGHYAERSAKEKEADIFSDGFGSKEISRERSVGERRKSRSSEEESRGGVKDFSDDMTSVKLSESKKKRRSPEDDPFYTGFGYTNQRGDANVRHSENKPLNREDLMESSGNSGRIEENEGINFVNEEDEIFENVRSGEEITEERDRDYISGDYEIPEQEKPVKESSVFGGSRVQPFPDAQPQENSAKKSSVFGGDENKEPEPERPVKKSSVFDRDDDDLFSV